MGFLATWNREINDLSFFFTRPHVFGPGRHEKNMPKGPFKEAKDIFRPNRRGATTPIVYLHKAEGHFQRGQILAKLGEVWSLKARPMGEVWVQCTVQKCSLLSLFVFPYFLDTEMIIMSKSFRGTCLNIFKSKSKNKK